MTMHNRKCSGLPSGQLWVCCSLQHAHSTPTPNFSALQLTQSEERYLYLVPYRKYMHVINSRYTYFSKMTSVKDLWGSERSWFFQTEQMLSQWKLRWIESENWICFLFVKNQFVLGWTKRLWSFQNDLSVVFQWIMLRVLYTDVSGGWGTFGPVGTGNLFLHAGNQGPNRHVIGQDDQYWTLHAELGDKSSHNNNNNI